MSGRGQRGENVSHFAIGQEKKIGFQFCFQIHPISKLLN